MPVELRKDSDGQFAVPAWNAVRNAPGSRILRLVRRRRHARKPVRLERSGALEAGDVFRLFERREGFCGRKGQSLMFLEATSRVFGNARRSISSSSKTDAESRAETGARGEMMGDLSLMLLSLRISLARTMPAASSFARCLRCT